MYIPQCKHTLPHTDTPLGPHILHIHYHTTHSHTHTHTQPTTLTSHSQTYIVPQATLFGDISEPNVRDNNIRLYGTILLLLLSLIVFVGVKIVRLVHVLCVCLVQCADSRGASRLKF